MKRRRVGIRKYDQCFTGSDAVNVVLERLIAQRCNFSKDICRQKAVKVSYRVVKSVEGKETVICKKKSITILYCHSLLTGTR